MEKVTYSENETYTHIKISLTYDIKKWFNHIKIGIINYPYLWNILGNEYNLEDIAI